MDGSVTCPDGTINQVKNGSKRTASERNIIVSMKALPLYLLSSRCCEIRYDLHPLSGRCAFHLGSFKTCANFCVSSLPSKLLPQVCCPNHEIWRDVVAPSVSAKDRRQDQNIPSGFPRALHPLHPPPLPQQPHHSITPSLLLNSKVCALLVLLCFIASHWRVFSEEFTSLQFACTPASTPFGSSTSHTPSTTATVHTLFFDSSADNLL